MEPTSASIGRHRRTVRDCEHLPASHEAMIALMTRRLARTQGVGKVVPAVTGKVAARSQAGTAAAPRIMASLCNLVITIVRLAGAASIAAALRYQAAGSVAHCKRSRSAERLAGPATMAPRVATCYRRLRVRWVTPLGLFTASIWKRSSSASSPSHSRSPRPSTIGTTTMCA